MIKNIIYGIVLICLWSGAITLYGQVKYTVSFDSGIEISEVILKDSVTYTKIKIPGTSQTDTAGYPLLPVKYVKLLVPAGAYDFELQENAANVTEYKLENKIAPVQPPVPTGFYDTPAFVKPDKKVYNSDKPYPATLAETVESGYFRGAHILTVAVYPCKYYPQSNKLYFYGTIDFTLTYKVKQSNKNSVAAKDKETRKILKTLIDNPDEIDKFLLANKKVETKITNKSATKGIQVDCDYVIVTNEELAPAFNEFMAWKRRKGVKIQLVTVEEINQSYMGDEISGIDDEAGKLRQFLADAYNNGNGIKYALLAGDYTIVPIRYAYTEGNTTNENYIIPTDLYFADFDGDWEVDNDGCYGEPSDNVDFYPEIYVGRLLVTSKEEVRNWTRKVLLYERNPGNGDYDYLTKAFFTQADQMQDRNDARTVLSYATWITDTVIFEEEGGYDTDFTPNFPKGKDVIDEFNNHYGFASFMAHGGACDVAVATQGVNNSICNNCKYKVTSFDHGTGGCCWIPEDGNGFDNMTNADYPTIFYSMSCETMPFDDFGTPAGDRNMAEVYTCISKGGGPHYLGNTRYGLLPASISLFIYFVRMINEPENSFYNIGLIEELSKVVIFKIQDYRNRYVRFSHNLIGCPETEIWTAIPSKFTNVLITPEITNTNAAAALSLKGLDLTVNTGGVSDATICVMSALDNGSSYYQVRKNVSSATFNNVPLPYLVTITKHNYIPYLKNPDYIYIQDETITTDKYIYGKYFFAGENVTTSKPEGPAIIESGANVVFDATGDVYLKGGFEVKPGAEFEIK